MFTWVDYTVFGLTILISVAIGVYYARSGGRQKTTSEYLMADRSFSVLPVSLSLSVSYISPIAILGNSAEMHYYGATYLFFSVGLAIGMALSAYCAVPVLYPLQLTSLNEYLVHRFDSRTLVYLAWIWQVMRQVCYSGIVICGPATMFEAMSGFPAWGSILLIGLASTFYTTIGGFKAVIWTDVFQCTIMFGGVLTVLIRGLLLTGGEAFQNYDDGYRTEINVDPSPLVRQSVWSMLLSGVLLGYAAYTVSQTGVQRLCALRSSRDAKRAILLSIVIRSFLEIFCAACGVITFAFYAQRGCDPLKAGIIENPNQVLPYFVMDRLGYWGIPGLFVAAVFSGSLSTVSSNLNGIAALTWKDLLSKRFHHWSEENKARAAKLICFICGILSLLLGLLVANIGGTIMQVTITLTSLSLAPLMVVFIGGALVPRINWKSMLVGSLLSMAIAAWLIGGSLLYKTHQGVLPVSDLNCSRGVIDQPWLSNTTVENVEYAMEAGPEYTYSEMTTLQAVPKEGGSGFSVIYKISPFLILPVAFGLCMLVTPLLSYLPGCSFDGKKRRELFFPCIRKTLNDQPSEPEECNMISKNVNGV